MITNDAHARKILEHLVDICRKYDTKVTFITWCDQWFWVNRCQVKLWKSNVLVRKKKQPERGDCLHHYWDHIPLANPDCFKEFEKWVKTLK